MCTSSLDAGKGESRGTPVKEKAAAPGRGRRRSGRLRHRPAGAEGPERRRGCVRALSDRCGAPSARGFLVCVREGRNPATARERAFSRRFFRRPGEEKRNHVPSADGAWFLEAGKDGIRRKGGDRFPRCFFLRFTERCSGSRCRRRGFRRSRRRRDRRRGRRRHCPLRRW